MICFLCLNPARGFRFDARLIGEREREKHFCSMECMDFWVTKGRKMDWQKEEEGMAFDAGKAGFEYLRELGQTDIKKLNKKQFIQFIQCVLGNWVELRSAQK